MRMLDLFSGIGGFHKGFEKAGFTFDWVGFCEIDKYASAVYRHRFPEAEDLGDVKLIRPERHLPSYIDLLCGGFPCQAFSVAGRRRGFDDTRGTLFFEIARILRYYTQIGNPIPYLVLENVKGLLSHDGRRTFSIMYKILTDLGYTVEYEVLNTRNYGIPQNRERVFIVGYLGNGGGPKIFPIGEECATADQEQEKRDAVSCIDASYYKGADGKRTMIAELNQIGKVANGDAGRVFDSEGLACTLKALGGGWGAKTGLYKVGDLKIIAKKRMHDTPKEINEYLKANKNGKTIGEIADSTKLPKTQVEHYFRSDKYRAIPSPKDWMVLKELLGFDDTYDKQVTEIYEKEVEFESSRRVYSSEGISKTLDTNDSGYYEVQPVLTPDRIKKKQNGRRFKEDGEDMFTLTQQDRHGVMIRDGRDNRSCLRAGRTPELGVKGKSIRRLTPVECMRLQGFEDDWNEVGDFDGVITSMSDTQRYKQAGNAVTVDVVTAVAKKIRSLKLE